MFLACSSDSTPQEASQQPAVKEQKAANPKPKAVDNKAAKADEENVCVVPLLLLELLEVQNVA